MFESPHSWKSFVHTHGPKLFRYFCARFDQAIAADLVQETLIRLLKKLRAGDYDPKTGDLIAYAFGIAKYVAMEAYKSQSKETGAELSVFIPAPDSLQQDISDQNAQGKLREAIATLVDPEKEIILLLIDQDLTLMQIANITSLPLNTVKSHMHRAKLKIKTALEAKNISKEDLL